MYKKSLLMSKFINVYEIFVREHDPSDYNHYSNQNSRA